MKREVVVEVVEALVVVAAAMGQRRSVNPTAWMLMQSQVQEMEVETLLLPQLLSFLLVKFPPYHHPLQVNQ